MSQITNSKPGILLESGTNEVEFLRFRIGKQFYGINVSKVRQVLVFIPDSVVLLPGTAPALLGSVLFRGHPIPVIDLRLQLYKEVLESDKPALLLVTEFNQCQLAFVIDEVDNIMRCSWNEFKPMEHQIFGDDSCAIVGNIVRGQTVTPILDVEAVLGTVIPSASITAHLEHVVSEAPADTKAKLRLVCCEDSSILQKVLLSTLTKSGFKQVKMFPTGKAGYDYLSELPPNSVDIILSDIEMPELDGLSLCKQLRAHANFQKTPFLFFSSTITAEMEQKCLTVGGTGAFSKPQVEALVKWLDDFAAKKTS